jgi:threonine dehydrogenase-like Zn-dependent dehydrogenase
MIRLPSNVSLELGALLEPLGVAIHGSRRAALNPGSTVLVFGAGAVGLLCAAMSKVSGAATVIIADIQGDRVEFAVQNKFADAKIVVPMKRPVEIAEKLAFAKEVAELAKEAAGGKEVDAVFECTGVESCLQASIYVCTPDPNVRQYANFTVHSPRWTNHVDWNGIPYSNTPYLSRSPAGGRSHGCFPIRQHVRGCN